jgi:hypothetical protein
MTTASRISSNPRHAAAFQNARPTQDTPKAFRRGKRAAIANNGIARCPLDDLSTRFNSSRSIERSVALGFLVACNKCAGACERARECRYRRVVCARANVSRVNALERKK